MTTSTLRHNGSFIAAASECWLGASTIACQFTAKAWHWYIQAFFSESAIKRYIWLGQMICCLALLAYWSGVYCGSKTAAYIESCQARQALPQESVATIYPTTLLPAPAVCEAEFTFEKIESKKAISPYTSLSYQELKDLAKNMGHPKPHMTKKVDLVAFIEANIPF